MKKFTNIVMVVMLCLCFLLTACGNTTTTPATTEATTEATTVATTVFEEDFYDFGGPLDDEEEGEPENYVDATYGEDIYDVPEATIYEDFDIPVETEPVIEEEGEVIE